MVAVYSYDMNVLRGHPKKGKTKFIPLSLGGRRLTEKQLEQVARNNWGKISRFEYLKEGEG